MRLRLAAVVCFWIFGGWVVPPVATAETFSKAQVGCALGLQAVGERVALLVADRFVRCAKQVSRRRLPSGQSARECQALDPGQRIARARRKAERIARKRCNPRPPFGPHDATLATDGLSDALRISNVFGSQLETALIDITIDKEGALCQQEVAKGMARLTRARLKEFRRCMTTLLRKQASPATADLLACLDADPRGRIIRTRQKLEDRAGRRCGDDVFNRAFRTGCRGGSVGAVLDCAASEVQCGTCVAIERACAVGAPCAAITGVAPNTICQPPSDTSRSVARTWDEELLAAIRIDLPRPPVHARNLFHLSVAMWDAWAAYDATADQYLHHERRASVDIAADRATTISFAAYRVLRQRYALSANAAQSRAAFDDRMEALGYDRTFESEDGDTAAALGNRIAATILNATFNDGANEEGNYADPTYVPLNEPMIVKEPGTLMVDPNHWQPLALDQQIGQNGVPIPGRIQKYVGSQWGAVTPFALVRANPLDAYLDPGAPPLLGGTGDALFKARVIDLLRWTSQLTIDDGMMVDMSPASYGNNPLGTNDGTGYATNPVTGAPYTPQLVKRGDFARVLAEYWADGPTSETPPGHWNSVANAVNDHPALVRRLGGVGPELDPLEWDVKLYLALNGALHDAAVQCWGVKRRYDYARPISMVRYMGGLGQSSDPSGPAYHPAGLPLEPGLVEVITSESSAPGQRHAALAAHVGEIAVYSWPGQPADPRTQYSGVRWVRAVTWVPYQRDTFVTPPFAAYTSGHSTYSRAGAELLTRFTGSSYFPGGLGEYVIPVNGFLQFEIGPSTEVRLQWAQYYDAADQAGISRLLGGIHVMTDDFAGRIAGAAIGPLAYDKAVTYFNGTASQ